LTTVVPGSMLNLPLPSHSQSADGTLHFHFLCEYSKPDRVKMMGSCGTINTILLNIELNLSKLVNRCGYELSTISVVFFGGGATLF